MIISEWFKNPPESFPEQIRDLLIRETKDALKTVVVNENVVFIFTYDGDSKNLGKVNVLLKEPSPYVPPGMEHVYLFKGGKLENDKVVFDEGLETVLVL